MSRLRGNGSGSITSYKTTKGKKKYRIKPSAQRTVEAAWGYCDDIARLPLKKLGRSHIEAVMKIS